MIGEPSEDAQRRGLGSAFAAAVAAADPSAATTALMLREVGSLKELADQRMSAIEKAVAVAHDDLVRVPTEVQREVGALSSLVDAKIATLLEKFKGIDTQFKELNTRIEQTAKDAKTAIDAALLAAEKAVGKQQEANAAASQKSDTGFTKQIDQLGTLTTAMKEGLMSSIDDIKERISRIESTNTGRSEEKHERRQDNSLWTAIGGLVMALIAFAAGFLANR